ncbi:MAG: ABC transporter permease [Herbinix sp.]|nr:ABC transporter permease [Herbinix sp.]
MRDLVNGMAHIGIPTKELSNSIEFYKNLGFEVIHMCGEKEEDTVALSTQSIWQSAAYLISGGMPMTMVPKVWPYINWAKVSIGFLPLICIGAVALMVVYYQFQRKMVLGRTMLALGSNEKAARLIGLNVSKAKLFAFVLSRLSASLGGIFFAVKLKSGIPTVGGQYTLMAIASAVLGGVLLTGGKGNVLLTILGVALITVIQNGMNVIAVDGFWQQNVFGLLVIIAIYMNTDKSRRDLIVK